jgi:hypothetical protein
MERVYNIVVVNDCTKVKSYLTRYPMNHDRSCVMLSKQSEPAKYVRILLEEVTRAATEEIEFIRAWMEV